MPLVEIHPHDLNLEFVTDLIPFAVGHKGLQGAIIADKMVRHGTYMHQAGKLKIRDIDETAETRDFRDDGLIHFRASAFSCRISACFGLRPTRKADNWRCCVKSG